MSYRDGYWHLAPPDLPAGPHFPAAEVEAARERVRINRAIRRVLAAAGIRGVIIR